jgi:cytochrome c biogenesis protein CcmG/thiol:disulfide interchange protein DsbE
MNKKDRHSRKRGLWWLFAAIFLTFAVGTVVIVLVTKDGSDTASTSSPEAGGAAAEDAEVAPYFDLTLFDGTEFSLEEHLADDGRPVFLNLWASWCDPCRTEMPDIDAAARTYPDVLFLGVAVDDTRDAARAFAETIGVMYPLGADDSGEVADAYPVLGLPATFLIDDRGSIAGVAYGQLNGGQIESLLSDLSSGR